MCVGGGGGGVTSMYTVQVMIATSKCDDYLPDEPIECFQCNSLQFVVSSLHSVCV